MNAPSTTTDAGRAAAPVPAQLVDEHAFFTLDDLARACCIAPEWVIERTKLGLLNIPEEGGPWQFASATIVRARRIARLETTFGADPHLAALTTDLIEEVAQLRKRLAQLEARQNHQRAAPD